MVSEEHINGLYVTVPIYFCLLAGAAYWAHHRMEQMKHENVSDQLDSHYLGGRSFGPLLTAGTLFASMFSGYTVIGVPNDAFYAGFFAIIWLPSFTSVCIGFFGTGIRLRRTAQLRNHQSPVDFVTDRYQSQVLRYVIFLLQLMPTVIYLSVQVYSIKTTFNSIFNLDPDATYPVLVIMGLILLFEWVGGLSSVALTDSIQGFIMVAAFIIIPCVIYRNFGGWTDFDPETFPRPYFYPTPSVPLQWYAWQFALLNFSFFTLPHLIQRIYAARDHKSLKAGFGILTIGPWFTTFVGVFIGTVGVVMLTNDDGTVEATTNPFASILDKILNLGGFAKGAAIITITASLAAIMSTADSLIIAISQLITGEIIYPLQPQLSSIHISWIGKLVSLVAVSLAIALGLLWSDGITEMGNIQFSLSSQAVPAFMFGLYSTNKKRDAHPWILSIGAVAGSITVVSLYFGYIKAVEAPRQVNVGITGFLVNMTVIFLLEIGRRLLGGAAATEETPHAQTIGEEQVQILFPGRPTWDIPSLSKFGSTCLSPKLIWDSMEGINEPLANPYWCLLMFVLQSITAPWSAASEPPYNPSEESVFLYPPATINGLPWWFFKAVILNAVCSLVLLVGVYNSPNYLPGEMNVMEEEGVQDFGMEMARNEKGNNTDSSSLHITSNGLEHKGVNDTKTDAIAEIQ